MIVRYPTLQSGYLAYPAEKGIVIPESTPSTPVGMIIQPKMTRTQQDYFYSEEVEALLKEVVGNPFAARSLEFQARVFEICGVLFDRKGFYNFMAIQEEGKHMSLEHILFLEDTLNAVCVGMPRKLEPIQWSTMISAANSPTTKPYRAHQVTSKVGCRPADDLATFLQQWVNGPGFLDLLMSLQTLFGRRTLGGRYGLPKD